MCECINAKYPSFSRGMLQTLGNMAGNVVSTVVGGVGRLVDVRPTYRQIGNFVVKGASYESFDSSGLFGISGDSSGMFGGLQGVGQIGSSLWGASGGTDASDGSGGGGISSYLPSGQSAGIAFGISAVLALFPVALILNHMITMPLIMRICVAIVVYGLCLVNPFIAIPIYLFYILRMAVRYNANEKYLLFPFFGFWPLRIRKVTDGAFITALTWVFSYLDPDLSKERHVKQRKEYAANAELYVASLVSALRLPQSDITSLGINKLAQKVLDNLMEPLKGGFVEKVEEPVASVASAVPVPSAQKAPAVPPPSAVPTASAQKASAVPAPSAVAAPSAQKAPTVPVPSAVPPPSAQKASAVPPPSAQKASAVPT